MRTFWALAVGWQAALTAALLAQVVEFQDLRIGSIQTALGFLPIGILLVWKLGRSLLDVMIGDAGPEDRS